MQQQIIKAMQTKPSIDCATEITLRVTFIKEQLLKSGMTSLVLGISGGQDSTLVGKLCQLAINELNSEIRNADNSCLYQFIAMRQPYGVQLDEADCSLALDFISPDKTIVTNIKAMVDSSVIELVKTCDISDFNKGNIKARCRMIMQYAIASKYNGLVVGTDHSAENITGFFTKYGDGGVDICPIFGLNKRQGKQLLKYLDCPESLYLKAPTADLEDNQPLLPDESVLGVSYDEIDDYLEGKIVSSSAKKIIEKLYLKSNHKRFMPIIPLNI